MASVKIVIYRSSKTGQFVSAKFAKKHPATTQKHVLVRHKKDNTSDFRLRELAKYSRKIESSGYISGKKDSKVKSEKISRRSIKSDVRHDANVKDSRNFNKEKAAKSGNFRASDEGWEVIGPKKNKNK